mmetsp:Transcript_25242/g.63377  ORF Transcript_25242/g.63377 Transcript_25242/m.63377 type:complete len:201 (-) Transcript_25242:18-620(-)
MFGGKKKEEASKKKEDAVSSTKEYTLWKVLLIGDDSDATRAFLDRVLLHEGDAAERLTGFRFSTRILPVNGVLVKVQLYSPWSIRDVRQLSASYYRGTAGVLFLYNACRRATFAHVARLMQSLPEATAPQMRSLLVAVGGGGDGGGEEVSPQEGQALAESLGVLFHTAATPDDAEAAFQLLLTEAAVAKGLGLGPSEGAS